MFGKMFASVFNINGEKEVKRYYEVSTSYLSNKNTFPLVPGYEPKPCKVKIEGESIWLWIHVEEHTQRMIISNVAEVGNRKGGVHD